MNRANKNKETVVKETVDEASEAGNLNSKVNGQTTGDQLDWSASFANEPAVSLKNSDQSACSKPLRSATIQSRRNDYANDDQVPGCSHWTDERAHAQRHRRVDDVTTSDDDVIVLDDSPPKTGDQASDSGPDTYREELPSFSQVGNWKFLHNVK